ncbi:IclR family transcriptional regulator [Streptomyces sp. WAC 01529]|uniref:IclR family transcriptional regulator n=1 Tax=Streptomyces sp. WAC 01529 TaxID=2203205 RepID=UPI000F6DF8A5|nr:helix-turn-helix domain-containing protein [Streptomyces sp. WAC 01529]AZM56529.1 IclR family transcriptional regulator [Streptomyces sp. WAC 01529]
MNVATRQPARLSGIGVLDKASAILDLVEKGPASLTELVVGSGYARPTVHRIAQGLHSLGLLDRDYRGRFVLGARLGYMAAEVQQDRLVDAASTVLADLRALTGLDARLFRRRGAVQICVGTSAAETEAGDDLPVGTARSVTAGPSAQTLLAWAEPEELYEQLRNARFTAAQLSLVRRRGWAHGPDALVPDAVSLAVPVRAMGERVVAALSLTGPPPRMPAVPSRLLLGAVIDAAGELGDELVRAGRVSRSRAR